MARARWQFDAPSLRRSGTSRPAVIDDQGRPLVRMQCLGAVAALVGEDRLDSSSDTLFALLVRSVFSPGYSVGRDVLLRSLWPAQTDNRQRANLRQALYKLRLLGVRIGLKGDVVQLDPSQLSAVFAVERSVARFDEDVTRGDEPFGLFLPGYQTGWPEYDEWLVMQRESVHSDVRRVLVGQLSARRERADWIGADALARWLLQFDPLNEEATLTVAECLARNGSKMEAVALIDRYLEELGPDAGDLRLSATLLRRRITEPQRSGKQRISLAPTDRHFVGRDTLMSELTLAMRRSKWGEGSALLLHAAPGMGKTRVTQELAKSAALEGYRVITVECRESDQYRPLALFLALVPELLDMPGAMACDPERLRVLRRLASQEDDAGLPVGEAQPADGSVPIPTALTSQMPLPLPSVLRKCIVELLVNVCYERATLFIADDMQWVDDLSASVLADIAGAAREAKLFVLATSRVTTTDPVKRMIAGGMEACALPGLSDHSARQLADLICADTGMTCSSELQAWFVRACEGTPLFLRGLLHHWVDTGAAGGIPPTLAGLLDQRISALSEDALRIMQAASVLGRHATIQTIAEVLELPVIRMIGALEELGDAGAYTHADGTLVLFHELISRAAVSRLSAASTRLFHSRVAHVLQTPRFQTDDSLPIDVVEHLQLTGSTEDVVSYATRAASRFVHYGSPLRALAVCEAVHQARLTQEDIRTLGIIEVAALHAAGRHSTILSKYSDTLGGASPDQTWDEEHVEQVLRYIDASRHSPVIGEIRELFARALLLSQSVRLVAEQRLAAAKTALRCAADIYDFDGARRAFAAGSRSISEGTERERAQHELSMFYHTVFGDHQVARTSAQWLRSQLTSYDDVSIRITLKTNIAHALRVSGDPEGAYQLACETFDETVAAHLPYLAAANAWNACMIAFDHFNDVLLAEKWLQHELCNEPEVLDHHIGLVHQYNRVRAALVRREPGLATDALSMISESRIDRALPFRTAYYLAMQLGTAVLTKDLTRVSALLADALETLSHTKRMTGQDFLVSQIVSAFVALGRQQEGVALRKAYLAEDRRPGAEVPAYLFE
ncbi:MAG: AAA family ATPase [Gemmatimonadota bacterium]